MNRIQKICVFLVVIIFGAWFYFLPHLAIRDMKSSIKEKDAVSLSDHVNFPALKESFKANINAQFFSTVSKEKDDAPFGALGVGLAAVFIGPMVDALVTPEGVAMMMKGDKPQLLKKKIPSKTPDSEYQDKDVDELMSYESFDRFVHSVKKKDSTEEPVILVFNRDGIFSWKLSAIRMPNNIDN